MSALNSGVILKDKKQILRFGYTGHEHAPHPVWNKNCVYNNVSLRAKNTEAAPSQLTTKVPSGGRFGNNSRIFVVTLLANRGRSSLGLVSAWPCFIFHMLVYLWTSLYTKSILSIFFLIHIYSILTLNNSPGKNLQPLGQILWFRKKKSKCTSTHKPWIDKYPDM